MSDIDATLDRLEAQAAEIEREIAELKSEQQAAN